MTARTVLPQGQQRALQRLVDDGTLSADQAAAVRTGLEAAGEAPTPARGWLIEAVGYLGGALTFAGAALLVGLSWEELSRPGRVLVLAAVTVVLAAAAIVIGGGPLKVRGLAAGDSTVRRRVVSVLLALSAGTAALAAGVAVEDNGFLVGSAVGLVLAAALYAFLPGLPVLLAAGVLSLTTGIALVNELGDGTNLQTGLLLVAIGAGWVALGLTGVLPQRTAGAVVGAVIALFGAQQPLFGGGDEPWAYLLTLLVALGCFAAYTVDRSLLLLATGVIAMTLVVSEAVADWTNGALGGAAAVLTAGAVLLAGTGLALRLHKRRTSTQLH